MATDMAYVVFTLALATYLTVVAGSGGSSTSPLCPDDKFHCPYNGTSGVCMPREYRCVGHAVKCTNPETGIEESCNRASSGIGRFDVFDGWTPLPGLGSISKRQTARKFPTRIKHQFITYRGFTYEFGLTYSLKELDINDPNYKYRDSGSLTSYTKVGESNCSREDLDGYLGYWRTAMYNLWKNHCQSFAGGLRDFLLTNCDTSTAGALSAAEFYNNLANNCTSCNIDVGDCVDETSGTDGVNNSGTAVFGVVILMAMIEITWYM